MFFLSLPRAGGGPGRALCTPTFHGLSDGPYRRLRFSMRPVRHEYRNVLVSADVRKLAETARELLREKQAKRRAFWEIFSKRVKASSHLLSPAAMALIARSFDVHNRDTGIYVALATVLPACVKDADGRSLLSLSDIFSRRLKLGSNPPLFEALARHLPNTMYQLTAKDVVRLLAALDAAGHADLATCQRVARKLRGEIELLDCHDLAEASAVFAGQGYRNPGLYQALARRAVKVQDSFDAHTLHRMLSGFSQNAVACDELLTSFSVLLVASKEKFSNRERRIVEQLVADSDAPLKELRASYKESA
ncbi:hypothetical protein BESB_071190 [Besnoitia besnoiti]|uniref:RAP domain-containing protein n=1 Tax=Besnoitia besnoiti TaxID=94643 RepID=A0A2A9MEB3_BESBE|nr:uncharacterized protein BESB_071190 [Besnoitia besnoiti]PFH33967.1 hypothetical protein BESB_071190 [Besnoitia besnoiti]